MADSQLGREGVVAATTIPEEDISTFAYRKGVIPATVRPSDTIATHAYRVGVYVCMSRPHGWGVFDDPPLTS